MSRLSEYTGTAVADLAQVVFVAAYPRSKDSTTVPYDLILERRPGLNLVWRGD